MLTFSQNLTTFKTKYLFLFASDAFELDSHLLCMSEHLGPRFGRAV
jgi:hypothetical protein